jgi:hypothetical protein
MALNCIQLASRRMGGGKRGHDPKVLDKQPVGENVPISEFLTKCTF